MHRLERWRNAIEETRRALKKREPAPSDPAGMARLREWAWDGLDRIAWITYRVEKPQHDISPEREVTRGRVRFTIGGFRANGTRVERSADVLLSVEWDPRRDPTPKEAPPGARSRIRSDPDGSHRDVRPRRLRAGERLAAFPRRHGRSRPRRAAPRSAVEADQPPDRRHLARLRRRGPRLQRRRFRGPLRRRRRALDPLQERRTRPFHRRHRRSRARQAGRQRHRRHRSRRGRRGRRRPARSLRHRRLRPRTSLREPRRWHLRGDDWRFRHFRQSAMPARRHLPTWTATATSTSSCASPAITTTRCPIPPTTRTTVGPTGST